MAPRRTCCVAARRELLRLVAAMRAWHLTISGTPSQEVRWKEGTSMARQTVLDLRAERLRTVWQQLPDRCRAEAVAIWTQLIMRAARRKPGKKGGPA